MPITSLAQLDLNKTYTYADYMKWQLKERVELLREKFSVYEESGVREYWLVNPLDRMVLIYVLNAQGKYIGLAPVTEDDQLQASIFPELQINLQEVFKS